MVIGFFIPPGIPGLAPAVFAAPGAPPVATIPSKTDLNFMAPSKLEGLTTYISTLHAVILFIRPDIVDLVGSTIATFKILPTKSNGRISFLTIKSFGNFFTASFFTSASVN